jgi:DNA-binding CsgD family transcriptional regulator
VFWERFFGRNSKKIKVLEGLKCFKCDNEGFALICKVKFLDENLSAEGLLSTGSITSPEILYREGNGSCVIFVSGKYSQALPWPDESTMEKVCLDRPPEFSDMNTMKVSIVGEDAALQQLLKSVEKLARGTRILSLTRLKPKPESLLSALTDKQRKALLTAYGLGYYDVPRRIPSEDIAKLLKIDKSTFAEHLRKAEKRIVGNALIA